METESVGVGADVQADLTCPDCGEELERIHHPPSFALPECWTWACGCGYRTEPE